MNRIPPLSPPNKLRVIGVILAYNCASMLKDTYERLRLADYTELILVDDGSTDDTVVVARALGLNVYEHPHMGYGGNLKFGLTQALALGADYMVEIHGDGQYASTDVAAAIQNMQSKDLALLLGSRFARSWRQPLQDGISYVRYAANVGLSFFDWLVLQLPLTEYHSGFRVYRRDLLETIGFVNTSQDYLYSFEIIAQAKYYGFRVDDIPVRCDYLEEHTSISLKKSTIYALQTFKVLGLYILSAWLGRPTKLFRARKV